MGEIGYNPPTEERRCSATSKQTGEQCKNWSVPGRGTCRFHGGLGGRPPSTGRYSRVLKTLRDKYEGALADDRLLDLRETLAVMDAALVEQLELAEQGASPKSWTEAFDLMRKFMKVRDSDPVAATEVFRELYNHLRDGSQRAQAMESVMKTAERRAIRAEAAWGIRLSAAQAINVRDLITIFARLVTLIEDELGPVDAKRVIERIDVEILNGALSDESRRPALEIQKRKSAHHAARFPGERS